MNRSDRKLRDYLQQYTVPPYDSKKMKQTVRLARQAYHDRLLSKRIGLWEFIRMQVRFIGRGLWLSQAVLLVFALVVISLSSISLNEMRPMFLTISGVVPLIAFLGFPEIMKSYSNGMAEIEACTRFSIRKLVGARMLILGLTDLCCLTIILAASVASSGLPVLRMILYLSVPFNVTCCGCLTVLDHVKNTQSGYYCSAVGVVCIAVFLRLSFIKEYYEAAAMGAWIILFFCSLVYFVIELIRTFRGLDRLFGSKQETLSVPW